MGKNTSSLIDYALQELKSENYRLKDELQNIEQTILKENINLLGLQHAALEASANGIVITDHEGTILWANKAFSNLTGYSTQEAIGQSTRLLKSGKHPDSFYKNLWETISGGNVWRGKIINKRKDETLYTEQMTITPIKNENNKISHYVAIKEDITEKIKQERILKINRNSVENSSMGIVWVNLDSELIYTNKAMQKMTGYSQEEISKLHVRDIDINWPTKEYFDSQIQQLRQSKSLSFETKILHKNGKKITASVTLNLIEYNEEEIIIAYVNNISKEKAVREIEKLLIKSKNLNEFLEGVHKIIDPVIPAPNFYIALLDEEDEMVSFPYFVDQVDSVPEPRKKGKGLTEYIIRSQEPLLLTSEVFNTLVSNNEVEPIGKIPESYLAVPLFVDNRAQGVLVLQSYDESITYTEDDLSFLSSIGNMVSAAIQRKITENKLSQYKKSVENAAIGILWLNKKGKIIFSNSVAEKYISSHESNIINKELHEILNQDKLYFLDVVSWLNDQPIFSHELILKEKENQNRILEISYTNFTLDSNELIIAYLQDITRKKVVEKNILETGKKLDAISNSISESIITIDKDFKIVLWNNASKEIFGFSKDVAINKKINEIITTTDFNENLKKIKDEYITLGKELTFNFIAECNKINEELFQAEISAAITLIDSEPYLTLFVRDQTEKNKLSKFNDLETEKYISELQNQLSKVKSEYEMLNFIFNKLPQKIYVKDTQSRFIKLNKAAYEQMGFKNEKEALGKTDFDVFKNPNAEEFLIQEKNIMKTLNPLIGNEHEELLKDGHKLWGQTSKFPLLNKDGKVLGTFGITNDLTEKKLVENELRDSQYKFRKLIENATIGIMRLDKEGEVIMANPALVKMLGYEDELEVISKPSKQIFGSVSQHKAFLNTLINEKQVLGFENVMLNSSGQFIDVRQSAWSISDHNNNLLYYEIVIEDITEQNNILKILHESENKYRTLIDNLNEAVFVIFDYKVEIANKKFLEILAITDNDLMTDTLDIRKYLTKESAEILIETNNKLKKEKEISKVLQLSILNKNEDEIDVEVSLSSFYLNGEYKVQGIMRDLTEIKKQETRIRHLQKMEAIGTLAAGIAHEINTPAQFINDNLSFLKDSFNDLSPILNSTKKISENNLDEFIKLVNKTDIDFLSEEIPLAIDQSIEGVQRIANIVGAMRDFSHSGPKDKQQTDLHKILNTSIILSKNAWKYIAEIKTDFDESLPHILCRPNDLSQVFVNMIVNASHALESKFEGSHEVQGLIQISTKQVNDMVEIKISDNGSGMSEKVKARIFDPFFTTKEVGKGTGQGLAIAHDIITDKHNGKIEVESKENEGTTFIITLPIE